jgi:hypothetical protein
MARSLRALPTRIRWRARADNSALCSPYNLHFRNGSDSAVGATLAAQPVYPRKLTTCCNAQVVSLGPIPDSCIALKHRLCAVA